MKTREESSLRRSIAFSTALALLLTSSPLASRTQTGPTTQMPESPIEIAHDPIACMTPALAPEVDAGVTPPPDYDRGYVYFRSAGTEDYYYVRMDGPPTTLAGILPRPKPVTKAVDYYLRAYDLRQASKRRGDWTPPVVPGTTCKAKGIPVGPAGAGLTIGLTREGQPPYPPGFNEKDIAKIILVSGAIVTIAEALKSAGATSGSGAGAGAGAGTAGAAGGLSTAAIVAGGVAVAGAAAYGISEANKDDTPPTPTPTPTPTIPPLLFVQADVSWSGVGDVDVRLFGPSGQVGERFPAACESTANRTERVILRMPPSGAYRVELQQGTSCVGPSLISAVLSVQTDRGPINQCAKFTQVGTTTTVECTFSLPLP